MNKTICANCKHHKRTISGMVNLCKASPLDKEIDPITGRTENVLYKAKDGTAFYSCYAYRSCEVINKGNCSKFEQKVSFFKRILNKILG